MFGIAHSAKANIWCHRDFKQQGNTKKTEVLLNLFAKTEHFLFKKMMGKKWEELNRIPIGVKCHDKNCSGEINSAPRSLTATFLTVKGQRPL